MYCAVVKKIIVSRHSIKWKLLSPIFYNQPQEEVEKESFIHLWLEELQISTVAVLALRRKHT